jgi:hypothetical protein
MRSVEAPPDSNNKEDMEVHTSLLFSIIKIVFDDMNYRM